MEIASVYEYVDVIRVVLFAVVCGAVVGYERERHQAPAGFKTQILICAGSAVFTLAAKMISSESEAISRVVAQIVTGVGFLGAGAIMHTQSSRVAGLTTAAWIWLVSSMGILCGLDRGPLAIFITVVMVAVSLVARRVERNFIRNGISNDRMDGDV